MRRFVRSRSSHALPNMAVGCGTAFTHSTLAGGFEECLAYLAVGETPGIGRGISFIAQKLVRMRFHIGSRPYQESFDRSGYHRHSYLACSPRWRCSAYFALGKSLHTREKMKALNRFPGFSEKLPFKGCGELTDVV